MRGLAIALFACLTSLAASGCTSSDLVELRLYPCEFAGVEPRAVTVEITGYDAADAIVETFEVPFDDIDARTFADGYASVGYRKQGDVVRARFRVGWFDESSAGAIAEADAIAVYEELVPDAGEVLVLGELAADCAALADESGSESVDSSSTDADSSSTDAESSSTNAESTTEADTSSTEAETSTTDTTDTTDTTTGGDPPGPMPGDACNVAFGFYCSGGPTPEDAGVTLLCPSNPGTLEPTDLYSVACDGLCPLNTTPTDACANIGDAVCLCLPQSAPDCMGQPLGCVNPDELHLCLDGKVAVAECPNAGCGMTPEGWFTCD